MTKGMVQGRPKRPPKPSNKDSNQKRERAMSANTMSKKVIVGCISGLVIAGAACAAFFISGTSVSGAGKNVDDDVLASDDSALRDKIAQLGGDNAKLAAALRDANISIDELRELLANAQKGQPGSGSTVGKIVGGTHSTHDAKPGPVEGKPVVDADADKRAKAAEISARLIELLQAEDSGIQEKEAIKALRELRALGVAGRDDYLKVVEAIAVKMAGEGSSDSIYYIGGAGIMSIDLAEYVLSQPGQSDNLVAIALGALMHDPLSQGRRPLGACCPIPDAGQGRPGCDGRTARRGLWRGRRQGLCRCDDEHGIQRENPHAGDGGVQQLSDRRRVFRD